MLEEHKSGQAIKERERSVNQTNNDIVKKMSLNGLKQLNWLEHSVEQLVFRSAPAGNFKEEIGQGFA